MTDVRTRGNLAPTPTRIAILSFKRDMQTLARRLLSGDLRDV